MKIRRAKPTDAGRIAALSGQLGYPTTKNEMSARLGRALKQRNGACFIAETPEHGGGTSPFARNKRNHFARLVVIDDVDPGRHLGDQVKQGDRMGMIRFGSRVDVFVPLGTKVRVAAGQMTTAGVTVLGEVGAK